MRVFGLWHGGASYSHGDLDTDCESWASLESAKRSLQDRYLCGYWERDNRARVVNVDEEGIATLGAIASDLHPCVTADTSIDLYPATRVPRDDARECRWCNRALHRGADGAWQDYDGDPCCDNYLEGCGACEDGESHPHAPGPGHVAWRIGDYPYARLTLGPRGGVRVESY